MNGLPNYFLQWIYFTYSRVVKLDFAGVLVSRHMGLQLSPSRLVSLNSFGLGFVTSSDIHFLGSLLPNDCVFLYKTYIRCILHIFWCDTHTLPSPSSMVASPVPTGVEYEAHDLWSQPIFCMLMAGCSGSGKSMLTTWLVAWSTHIIMLVFHSHMQGDGLPSHVPCAAAGQCTALH